VVDVAVNGSIRFQVPDVRPGGYQLFVLYSTVRAEPGREDFVPVADFNVTDPSGRYLRRTVPWVLVAAGAIADLLLVTAHGREAARRRASGGAEEPGTGP
jgi:hypothetical protein